LISKNKIFDLQKTCFDNYTQYVWFAKNNALISQINVLIIKTLFFACKILYFDMFKSCFDFQKNKVWFLKLDFWYIKMEEYRIHNPKNDQNLFFRNQNTLKSY
jgi:hypothetical protein